MTTPPELNTYPRRSVYWRYALAFLGAHLAFMPLLVLLLPRHVEAIAPDNTANVLSWLLLTGGIIAGLANMGAGALGDRWLARFGSRRGLIAIGAGMLFVAYAGLAFSDSVISLFAAFIVFQISLNCCFSPLGALLADHFPDEVKGRLGGLLTAALPASTLLVAPIAWLFLEDGALAFLLIGAVVLLCMLPLLILWGLGPVIGASDETVTRNSGGEKTAPPHTKASLLTDFSLAWASRLLIQTGAAFVIGYIYLYLSVAGLEQGDWQSEGPSEILAALTAPSAFIAILTTLAAGFVSDRANSRRLPLLVFACFFGVGMGMLAMADELVWFFIGYLLLQTALAAYLSVDIALFAQLVSGNPKRGLLLGVMNLSNTLPSVIVPIIALLAFNSAGLASILATMFAGFAIAALVAGGLIAFIRSVR